MSGFDLASVLQAVSDSDTEERLVKLDLDLIDPDPENFYSLDGIDELAGNIELVGLLDPIRVRPGAEGRFTVVSGHRRRAAIMLIRDGGSGQFRDGVPCIVEYGEASDAMRKLRLIYANSSTRQLSPAEQSKQAEEVTRILYELAEQGVHFPGRMRDHVAEACRLSKTKIARLHAIRANLIPELLGRWDAGEVKEETAYQLSRYPVEIQRLVAERMADPKIKNWPYGGTLESYLKVLGKSLTPGACPAKAGEKCSNCERRVLHDLFNYDWAWCNKISCCLDCAKEGRSCSFMCKAGKDRLALDRAVEQEKEAKAKEEAASRREIEQKRLRKEAARLLALAERAGLADSVAIGEYGKAKVGELREIVAGKTEANKWNLQPYNVDDARRWAQKLKCSIGELLGEKPPKPAAAVWQTGTPTRKGWCAVRMKLRGQLLDQPRVLWWGDGGWSMAGSGAKIDDAYTVAAWLALPKEVET